MITGFNTDIEYEGVTYHVQTEDKGLDTPLILSLVYNRGTILASKRASYDDLLADKFDEKVLAQRLQKQHKLICAAVRAGRIEDLKRMTEKESAAKQKNVKKEIGANVTLKESKPTVTVSEPAPVENPVFINGNGQNVQKDVKPVTEKIAENPPEKSVGKIVEKVSEHKETIISQSPIPKPKLEDFKALPKPTVYHGKNESAQTTPPDRTTQPLKNPPFEVPKNESAKTETAIPKPKQEEIWDFPIRSVEVRGDEEEMIIEAVEIIEDDELILPAEAVEIVGDYVKVEPPVSNKLQVEFLTETNFRGGERKTVSILVSRGGHGKGISGAQIMVKVLGSSFRPLIFHAKTDQNGIAVVHLQLPHFRSGRAAILVRGMSDGEEAELRRVVSHG
ncbi:MAG: hypothetical protein LUM44_02870 [Pyrinomonadaceae bacterium]|nr:hypothetical protein [Pyrinomonadaceae bacterium]